MENIVNKLGLARHLVMVVIFGLALHLFTVDIFKKVGLAWHLGMVNLVGTGGLRRLEHGGHQQDDRACIAPEQSLGEVYQHDPAGTHGGARRWDRETVEDGDLKNVPIQLPSLPSPEGRDASLEAGDWLVQLEPLVGDLSRNAAGWWKRVMQATTTCRMASCRSSLQVEGPSAQQWTFVRWI